MDVLLFLEKEAKIRQSERTDLLKGIFVCECGEEFDRKVWHCPICAHHWLPHDKECRNCHEGRQRGSPKATLLKKFSDVDRNETTAAANAASLFGTNSHYVSDAKKIKETRPADFEAIKRGEKTIKDVKREHQRKIKESIARPKEKAIGNAGLT